LDRERKKGEVSEGKTDREKEGESDSPSFSPSVSISLTLSLFFLSLPLPFFAHSYTLIHANTLTIVHTHTHICVHTYACKMIAGWYIYTVTCTHTHTRARAHEHNDSDAWMLVVSSKTAENKSHLHQTHTDTHHVCTLTHTRCRIGTCMHGHTRCMDILEVVLCTYSISVDLLHACRLVHRLAKQHMRWPLRK